jgi:hypothetical protein
MSVFVSIAAYRDPVLGFTMRRAIETAAAPNALHFAVVDQNTHTPPPTGRAPRHLSYVRIDPMDARGPCWARALAMSFYDGEDWFLQIDSHMDFDPGWDDILIAQARALLPGRKGIVLTAYPNAFVLEDGKPVRKPVTNNVLSSVLSKTSSFAENHLVLGFEAHPVDAGHPLPGFHVGAGCLFTTGNFALEFPYDPRLYFHGEEQAITLRLFTHGWDVFHPVGCPIYHLYNDLKDTSRRPVHWDKTEEEQRQVRWLDLERRSQRRLSDLAQGKPLGAYGLGGERTIADYAAYCGIDYAAKTIDPRAYRPLPAEAQPP